MASWETERERGQQMGEGGEGRERHTESEKRRQRQRQKQGHWRRFRKPVQPERGLKRQGKGDLGMKSKLAPRKMVSNRSQQGYSVWEHLRFLWPSQSMSIITFLYQACLTSHCSHGFLLGQETATSFAMFFLLSCKPTPRGVLYSQAICLQMLEKT